MLTGRDPATVPIINLSPNKLALNFSMLSRLQGRWVVPADLMDFASIVIDEEGHRTVKVPRPPSGH